MKLQIIRLDGNDLALNPLHSGKGWMIELKQITSKVRITIAKELRGAFTASMGDEVSFERKDGDVAIEKLERIV
jgi:hypothetical protein